MKKVSKVIFIKVASAVQTRIYIEMKLISFEADRTGECDFVVAYLEVRWCKFEKDKKLKISARKGVRNRQVG